MTKLLEPFIYIRNTLRMDIDPNIGESRKLPIVIPTPAGEIAFSIEVGKEEYSTPKENHKKYYVFLSPVKLNGEILC